MTEPGWVEHAIWWQIYPLGFVGAFPADPAPAPDEHRLRRIADWLDHALELGASGIALGPVFASRTHGYDTTDHYPIDPRLGDDADFDHCRRAGASTWPSHPARRCVQPRGHRLRPLPGALRRTATHLVPHAARRFRHVRGPRRSDHTEPRQPGGRRLRRRRHVALAAPRRRRLATGRGIRRARPVLGAGPAPGPPGVPGRLVRRRGHPRRLRGHRLGGDVRLGHPVRTVEGDLEQPERRQLPRTRPRAGAARRSSSTPSCP